MRFHHLLNYFDHQHRRLIHHRDVLKRRVREDILDLEQEIALLSRLIRQMEQDRLTEAKPVKPLTPEQTMKRAAADRERQQKIRDIQASANKRIADIRAKIG